MFCLSPLGVVEKTELGVDGTVGFEREESLLTNVWPLKR